jgi:hypothetical protein
MRKTFHIDDVVVIDAVEGKYRAPNGSVGTVTDVYESPATGEKVYEVEFGTWSFVLVRSADLNLERLPSQRK